VFDYQPYALALASQLADIIVEYNIDVIHSHYALPHAISAVLAREMAEKKTGRRVKCVTTLHGTDITVVGSHPTMKNITRYAIEESDRVTCVSDFLKQETVKIFDIAPEKIDVIYNFINPKFFNPDLKDQTGYPLSQGCRTIIHASNLREVKDPLAVIKIFNGMLKKIPCLELLIVGEGPLEPDMVSLVKELDIEKSVKFLGIRNNIGSLLATSDLMLLPSKQESFGLAALEAMACGTPVLATRAGGLPEVITDGVDGLLFDPENFEQAVDKAICLLEDNGKFSRMRKEALKTANEKFPMGLLVSQYENIYK
jgi:N-acetyl-alpha-D-glucosaminyl L-malate synthase BshA